MSRLKITGYVEYDDVDERHRDPSRPEGITHDYWDGWLCMTYINDLEDVDIRLVDDE